LVQGRLKTNDEVKKKKQKERDDIRRLKRDNRPHTRSFEETDDGCKMTDVPTTFLMGYSTKQRLMDTFRDARVFIKDDRPRESSARKYKIQRYNLNRAKQEKKGYNNKIQNLQRKRLNQYEPTSPQESVSFSNCGHSTPLAPLPPSVKTNLAGV